MDRDFANKAASSDSKILVNVLDYDIKGGTQQNSSIILSPLENTSININVYNSNPHLMPLLYLNTMAGSLAIKLTISTATLLITKLLMTTSNQRRHYWE